MKSKKLSLIAAQAIIGAAYGTGSAYYTLKDLGDQMASAFLPGPPCYSSLLEECARKVIFRPAIALESLVSSSNELIQNLGSVFVQWPVAFGLNSENAAYLASGVLGAIATPLICKGASLSYRKIFNKTK